MSKLSTLVATMHTKTNSAKSPSRLPRPQRAVMWTATSNSPASSNKSATTLMTIKKAKTGQTRVQTSLACSTVKTPAGRRLSPIPKSAQGSQRWKRSPDTGAA